MASATRHLPAAAAVAPRRQMGDSADRETAKPLTTLGGVEPDKLLSSAPPRSSGCRCRVLVDRRPELPPTWLDVCAASAVDAEGRRTPAPGLVGPHRLMVNCGIHPACEHGRRPRSCARPADRRCMQSRPAPFTRQSPPWHYSPVKDGGHTSRTPSSPHSASQRASEGERSRARTATTSPWLLASRLRYRSTCPRPRRSCCSSLRLVKLLTSATNSACPVDPGDIELGFVRSR
jgi:hypothetical protein